MSQDCKYPLALVSELFITEAGARPIAEQTPRTSDSIDNPRHWARLLTPFAQADSARASRSLLITVAAYAALWVAMWLSLRWNYWLTLMLALPTAGLNLRLFTIQHDCGHGAYFAKRATNNWAGRVLSVLTLTPYDSWRAAHARHHATTGNLDRRGVGDVTTLTVAEYLALPRTRRLAYRLYRNPLVLFGLGGLYLFLLKHRVPLGRESMRRRDWVGTQSTNLAIAGLACAKVALIGITPFLTIEIPVLVLWTSIGVWMFYVEHQFRTTYWNDASRWDFYDAALYGSSHLDLPRVLAWCTGDNGIHHVHHLNSRIPNYRLRECLKNHPELAPISRLSLGEGLRATRLKLWDDERRELIGFDALPSRQPRHDPAARASEG